MYLKRGASSRRVHLQQNNLHRQKRCMPRARVKKRRQVWKSGRLQRHCLQKGVPNFIRSQQEQMSDNRMYRPVQGKEVRRANRLRRPP